MFYLTHVSSLQIDPQKLHFMEDNFMDSVTKTSEFWTECKEETMLNMHKRNRESGESKLKFQVRGLLGTS